MATNITFQHIKSSIIEYLSKQEQFKDFNWTAPAITTLVDALAYMGHYMSVYANFSIGEAFLDSAVKRSSVLSHAKTIGYVPQQYTSAKAKVKISYIGKDNLDDKVILAGTSFMVNNDDTTYFFRTFENAPIQKTTTGRYFAELDIREGTVISQKWQQDVNEKTRFVLSHPMVDTKTLVVRVYNDNTDKNGTEYVLLDNISQFGPEAPLYSIEETSDGFVELIFGDDFISKKITNGMVVEALYLTCNGAKANDLSVFSLVSFPDALTLVSDWETSTLEIASEGGDKESVDAIKMNAPKFFQCQGRNVNAEDYKADVLNSFSNIVDAVNAWGGEDNVPPHYGSVMLCIKPKTGTKLTGTQKQMIIDELTKHSVVGISVEITDPTVVYVNATIEVKFNKLKSTKQPLALQDEVEGVVMDYFKNNTSGFNTSFVYSKFISEIFALDNAITDINSNILLYQYFQPSTNVAMTYIIDFKNAITPGTVYIGPFIELSAYGQPITITDNGTGTLLYNGPTIRQVGSVDYESGKITLSNINFNTQVGESITVAIVPAKNNMSVDHNYVMSVNTVSVNIMS